MESSNNISFDDIAKDYRVRQKNFKETHIEYCIEQKSLLDAIIVAAKSIDKCNKIHDHQRRVGRSTLNNFAEALKSKEANIKKCQDFDQLLNVVEAVEFGGIGELTRYDIANRIGAYLNIFPEKIYLHAGTRIGVQNLLINVIKRKFIKINELPKDLLKHQFSAIELEDILCMYKENFNNRKSTITNSNKKTC